MSTLSVGTIQSNSATAPPTINNSSGTEIGTFCRSWVNFNGTGSIATRGSFNVLSITDAGLGLYTLTYTTAMPDANYSIVATVGDTTRVARGTQIGTNSPTTTTTQLMTGATSGAGFVAEDYTFVCISIFR